MEDIIKYNLKTVQAPGKGEVEVLEFELPGPITPGQLQEAVAVAPRVEGKPLVISGRGPIWLYGALLHRFLHLVPWIGVYDPKVGGAIVVASHSQEATVGEVISLKP